MAAKSECCGDELRLGAAAEARIGGEVRSAAEAKSGCEDRRRGAAAAVKSGEELLRW